MLQPRSIHSSLSLRDKIFSFDEENSKCYLFKEKLVKCGEKPKTIHFA